MRHLSCFIPPVAQEHHGKPAGASRPAGLPCLLRLVRERLLHARLHGVRREVFEKMDEPVFSIDVGDGVNVTGEDNVFCDKAIALGYEIWLDTMLTSKCRHIDQDHELVPQIDDPDPPQIILPRKELILQ